MSNLTILIPVSAPVRQTYQCIQSILKSDASDCHILLLDDATPGGVEALNSLVQQHENIQLVSHLRHRGYTQNVQIGVNLCTTEYICILHNKTLVPSIWSKPLVQALQVNPFLAGVSPLSNAGSYPLTANCLFDLNTKRLDCISMLLHTMFQDELIDVPILNRFCSVFRQSAIDKANGFDVKQFPAEHGEDYDLCIRLASLGYRLSVLPSQFVYHENIQPLDSNRKIEHSKLGTKQLLDIYGSQHLSDITQSLKDSISLSSVRKIGRIIVDLLHKHSAENIIHSVATLPAGSCITIDRERNIVSETTHSLTHGKIELLNNGSVAIYAPQNRKLHYLEGFEIESMTSLLMYLSTREPILFDVAQNSFDAMNTQHREWVESLEFDRLYENNLQLAS